MSNRNSHIVIVGGGTSGAVVASRLSEDPRISVTLLEAGPDHEAYDEEMRVPGRAPDRWNGVGTHIVSQPMALEERGLSMIQGRVLGGTSAVNGLATLRGQPADYDSWAASGLDGWGWEDVKSTFIAAERDMDFGPSPIHGGDGPLPVRRWRPDELSRSQAAFREAMLLDGVPGSADINDPDQLPGIGVFPVTIDENVERVSTSLAYLTPEVRARENLRVRVGCEVSTIRIEAGHARGVSLVDGEDIEADEVVVTAGAIWSAALLLRSGVGPADHLADHGVSLQADLPVGSTMSDHIGPGIPYFHEGARGGVGGPAQVVLVGASNGKDIDYHVMPVSLHDPAINPLTFREKLAFLQRGDGSAESPGWRAALGALRFLVSPTAGSTLFAVAVFLLRSSGRGSVRLGDSAGAPVVVAPPLPDDGLDRLRHAFGRIAAWERSAAFRELRPRLLFPHDLDAPDAVEAALARNPLSYGHMVGTCPMGPVLDADCRVHGIGNLRVADASVMPTIPCGNTYLGCVMVAERIARKMKMG